MLIRELIKAYERGYSGAKINRSEKDWLAQPLTSCLQVFGTVGTFLVFSFGAYYGYTYSLPLTLFLAIFAGIALVRVFCLQHDCAHRSLFRSRRINDLLGGILGALTLVPHAYWRRMHLIHHATSGNLDRRGHGDILTLTVEEFNSRSPFARLQYRVYRHLVTMLVVGPYFQFALRFRRIGGVPRDWRLERRSILATDFFLLLIYGCIAIQGNVLRWLVVHMIVILVSAGIGIALFFIQHQVERPYWVQDECWCFKDAALKGSTYLKLSPCFEWLISWINLHHVHHFRPDIPNYFLKSYMKAAAMDSQGLHVTLREAVTAFKFKLYDEKKGVMVGFESSRNIETPNEDLQY